LPTPQIVTELYWAALTRPPTSDELAAASELFERGADRQAALEDLVWALLNAKEFVFRH
jgi:hypothetical protein